MADEPEERGYGRFDSDSGAVDVSRDSFDVRSVASGDLGETAAVASQRIENAAIADLLRGIQRTVTIDVLEKQREFQSDMRSRLDRLEGLIGLLKWLVGVAIVVVTAMGAQIFSLARELSVANQQIEELRRQAEKLDERAEKIADDVAELKITSRVSQGANAAPAGQAPNSTR